MSVQSTSNPIKSRIRGIVFDMDGTLTVPVIDFPAMYKAVLGKDQYFSIISSSPSGIDILHHIEQWSPDKQQKAYEIIADFERQGMDRLQIMPGNIAYSRGFDFRYGYWLIYDFDNLMADADDFT
ncbi:hypothetical protein E3N88_15009 [Mikania micrantha]|uniref:Uncharacterized protein n=1 Tax=Mikania micrantha TaxID=192012 RepID=A0A5N6P4T0_9ASTR|nr:hypothetical protein E3N88_15001 [Mikania micrantha]KAD5803649.1 hypothetical protein E3N88_15009 [Mikania micrantha]